MSTLKDGRHQLDEQKDNERLMAPLSERIDTVGIVLTGTEGKAKLQVQRFGTTDLGVRAVISLMINWEFSEDDYLVGDLVSVRS